MSPCSQAEAYNYVGRHVQPTDTAGKITEYTYNSGSKIQ